MSETSLQYLMHVRANETLDAARALVAVRSTPSGRASYLHQFLEDLVAGRANDLINLRAAMAADGLTP